MRIADLALRLLGATSGETIVRAAAAASGAITLPAGTTDFSSTGGASQVIRQSSAGGAFTVGQLAAADVSGALTGNQTITLSGDIAGSGATAITTTLPVVNATIGTFQGLTVNAKGQVTAAVNQNYLTSSGVSGMTAGQLPVAATATTVTSSVPYGTTGNNTVLQTGATGVVAAGVLPAYTGDVTSPAGSTVNTLATVNANVGTFQGLTVNAKGLVTAAANQSYLTTAVTSVATGTGLTGGTITGTGTISMANMAANSLKGNNTGSAAAPADLTVAQTMTLLAAAPLASPSFTGTVTSAGSLVVNGAAVSVGGATFSTAPVTMNAPTSIDNYIAWRGARNWRGGSQNGVSGDGRWIIYDDTAAAYRLEILTDGTCWNNTGTWNSLSDRRVKRDIEPWRRGLEAILAIDPVSYRRQEDGPVLYGVIADEIEPAVPELVSERMMQLTIDEPAVPLKGVDVGALTFVLINAVKELAAKVEALEARLAA